MVTFIDNEGIQHSYTNNRQKTDLITNEKRQPDENHYKLQQKLLHSNIKIHLDYTNNTIEQICVK